MLLPVLTFRVNLKTCFRFRGMAWRCSGASNKELCDNLKAAGIIKSEEVYAALIATDRKHYALAGTNPYEDAPQRLSNGQTISAPHMHAHALELLRDNLKPGYKVLDVGCGSGYITAAIRRMVGPSGTVVGIDCVKDLVKMSRDNITRDDPGLLSGEGAITLEQHDGWSGFPELAKYNAIHVGAAAAELPKALVEQLSPNGSMIIPVGPEGQGQDLLHIRKASSGSGYTKEITMGVVYVPLVKTK